MLTDELLARLRAMEPFSHLGDEQFAALLAETTIRDAAAGELLIRQDESDRDHLVLIGGSLEVRRPVKTSRGNEDTHLDRVHPGEGIGAMALLSAVPHHASVMALTPSRYLRINGDRVDEMLAWSESFAGDLRNDPRLRHRVDLIRQTTALQRLPLERVCAAFNAMRPVSVEAGQTIVRQGEHGDAYYLIESGCAEVWCDDPMSGKTACVNKLGTGDSFGEEALLLGGFRTATVTMTTPGVLLRLEKHDFDALMKPDLVGELTAEQAHEMITNGSARWLDCRYEMEYEESRIPGALLMPLDSLRQTCATLDPAQSYIVYCRSGRRSVGATFLLRERGFQAWSMIGGIRDWPYAVEGEAHA